MLFCITFLPDHIDPSYPSGPFDPLQLLLRHHTFIANPFDYFASTVSALIKAIGYIPLGLFRPFLPFLHPSLPFLRPCLPCQSFSPCRQRTVLLPRSLALVDHHHLAFVRSFIIIASVVHKLIIVDSGEVALRP